MAEPWIAPLETGDPERAWDLFIERYRRLIFGAIRRYTTESDDVMDVFARVCEVLRENDFARLRRCVAPVPGAPSTSTDRPPNVLRNSMFARLTRFSPGPNRLRLS